ncbi:MAG TPA: outer membrane protein assembly factor, partial [Thermoanaerobaculia bacterium]|nr:outer membrane protein assembly factor [Thermoanaerobaculia bacterium]
LYQPDDRSGRLYLDTGAVLGTKVSVEAYAQQRRFYENKNQIEDSRELALQLVRPLGRSTTARLYLRHFTTHVFQIDPDPFLPLDTKFVVPYLGAQLVRDTRDDAIDPRVGRFASLDLSGSGGWLGSDFEYLRLFAQGSAYRPLALAGRSVTWAQALRVGYAHPFAGQALLRQERFFAGGPISVRGYDRESLGPQEHLGTEFARPLGGEAMLVLNEELRFPLPWDLTGLVFFDAGQVWARPADADFDLAKSLGLGLRARTPLGLLRFDAAYPLDRRPGDAAYALYLGFGNAF